jgi:predicted dehydrogenase
VENERDRPLRYGFAGVGMMGMEHVRNVLALPGAEVVAVADPHGASLDAARAEVGDSLRCHDDVSDMVEAEELDVVVVSTPNSTHRSVLEPLWGRPLHLMIEKPLCTTVEDAALVRERAAEHPGVVWVGLEYRYMPPVARFVDEVRSGAAGRVVMLSVREHRYPFLVKVGDWNRFTRNTGGTLVEKCCHFFDLMRLVLDADPVRVLASGGQDVNHLDERYDTDVAEGEVPDILDNAFVVVDFDSGARAVLDLCMFAEGSRWEQELVATGDAGKVEANVPGFMEVVRGRRPELVLGGRGPDWPVEVLEVGEDERVAVQGGHHGASYLEHLAMVESIRSGARPQVGVEDGVWSVAMGVAAHRSIDEGRVVELSEVLPDDLLAELRRR